MFYKTRMGGIFQWVGLVLAILWSVFPIFFLIVSTFKPPIDIFAYPPTLFSKFSLQNFYSLFTKWPQFTNTFVNSILVTVGSTLLTIIVAMPVGYAFSRYRGRLINASAFLLLAVRMFPVIVLTIPLFSVFQKLGIIDSHLVLIVLYSTFEISMASWLMKTFMDEIPVEIEEAAKIDGANTFQVITTIIFPLSLQGVVATSVFVAIYVWNEFTLAFIFTATKARTAPILISEMLGSVLGIEWGPLFALATLQLIPILIFMLLVQEYLIKGLTVGSVKG